MSYGAAHQDPLIVPTSCLVLCDEWAISQWMLLLPHKLKRFTLNVDTVYRYSQSHFSLYWRRLYIILPPWKHHQSIYVIQTRNISAICRKLNPWKENSGHCVDICFASIQLNQSRPNNMGEQHRISALFVLINIQRRQHSRLVIIRAAFCSVETSPYEYQ